MLRLFRKVWPVLKVVLAVVIVVAVGRRFYLDLREHPDVWEQPLRPGWLVLCGALYLLGLGFSALWWFRLLRRLGQEPAPARTVRAYYVGHMGKYVPGKAWALFLRADLVRGPHVSVGLAVMTSFYEVFCTMASGVLLAAVLFALLLPTADTPLDGHRLVSLLRLQAPEGPTLDRRLAVPLAVGMLLPLLVLILPPVFNRLVHRLSLPFREAGTTLPRLGNPAMAEGLLLTGAGWLCLGASLGAVLHGVLAQPPLWDVGAWGRLTAYMGVSYVAGFVIMVPGGFGVREFFLTLFLAAELGAAPQSREEAAVVAAVVVLRLVWTAAEVLMAAAVGVPFRLRARPAPLPPKEGVP
jgi:uncharacterized membrane protein YbhN (UPF0104 family)